MVQTVRKGTPMRLNPNDADAWANLSNLKVLEVRGVEVIACAERALRLPRRYLSQRRNWA
jgi:hypothetical protein